MCGINGIFNYERQENISREKIEEMNRLIHHRGPDGEGIFVQGPLALAMRRLAIIDLQTGEQPIHNEDKTVWVVYNGETYNYVELADELKLKGHRFYTKSDTEVLVHLYEEKGERMVESLRGMFAFALWDQKKRRLLLARDRLGIKPLYYCVRNGSFYFASEFKSLLALKDIPRALRLELVDFFLAQGYAAGDQTMAEGIKSLPAGHLLTIDASGLRLERYWDLPMDPINDNASEAEQTDRLYELLQECVRLWTRSDVEVGCFLSGGIDSAAVAALANQGRTRPLKTFTVGYKDRVHDDETGYARETAKILQTEHYEIQIGSEEWWKCLPRYIWHTDDPIANLSQVTFFAVCELAKKYVKVVLSGAGGDEVFVGYRGHFLYSSILAESRRLAGSSTWRSLAGQMLSLGEFAYPHLRQRRRVGRWLDRLNAKAEIFKDPEKILASLFGSYTEFTDTERREIYQPALAAHSWKAMKEHYRTLIDHCRIYDSRQLVYYSYFKTWLTGDYLLSADKISMANSLELRVPFFDHQLVEFAGRMPLELLWKGEKYMLRRAMSRILPEAIYSRPKKPWGTPLWLWAKRDFRERFREILLDRSSLARGYFKPRVIERKLENHFCRLENSLPILWHLLYLEIWQRTFIDRRPEGAVVLPS